MRNITILGATGSLGGLVMDMIDEVQSFNVIALCAQNNWQKLAKLARKYKPKYVSIANESKVELLKDALSDLDIEIGYGQEGITNTARYDTDILVSCITGISGLEPLLEATKQEFPPIIATANKESIVCGGKFLMEKLKNIEVLPLDSEHHALSQILEGAKRFILTASGGACRTMPIDQLKYVSPADALRHPTWSMGNKITIDSATLMNKVLETLEASYLFDIELDLIDIVIHPQSIIHALSLGKNNSFNAVLGKNSMKTPVLHALYYPNLPSEALMVQPLDLLEVKKMDFESVDRNRFPSIELLDMIKDIGGNSPIVLNVANEILVENFLNNKIGFWDIYSLNRNCLEKIADSKIAQSLGDIQDVSLYTKEYVNSMIKLTN